MLWKLFAPSCILVFIHIYAVTYVYTLIDMYICMFELHFLFSWNDWLCFGNDSFYLYQYMLEPYHSGSCIHCAFIVCQISSLHLHIPVTLVVVYHVDSHSRFMSALEHSLVFLHCINLSFFSQLPLCIWIWVYSFLYCCVVFVVVAVALEYLWLHCTWVWFSLLFVGAHD